MTNYVKELSVELLMLCGVIGMSNKILFPGLRMSILDFSILLFTHH